MNTQNKLTHWNDGHWHPLADFRHEMEHLFDDVWITPVANSGLRETKLVPACDVEEGTGHYLLTLEMPGISKDDLKVEVVENQIVVSGERKHEKKSNVEGAWYSERRFGKFQRNFTLPVGVDPNKIEANYQDGILRLMVPKAESARTRQIKITNGSSGFFGKLLAQAKPKSESEKEEPYLSEARGKDNVA